MKLPNIGRFRSILYKTGKVLGDVNAVKRGTIGKRVTTRIGGKITSRVLNKIVRLITK